MFKGFADNTEDTFSDINFYCPELNFNSHSSKKVTRKEGVLNYSTMWMGLATSVSIAMAKW